MTQKLVIDQEFKDYMPRVPDLTDAELERQLIETHGPLHPIVTWKGIVIDGHRRYAICLRLQLPYATVARDDLKDRQAVKHWMDRMQICRRNLTPPEHAMVLARMMAYEEAQGGGIIRAAAKVAKATGVSTRTVYRAQDYKEAMESLSPELQQRIRSLDLKASMADVIALAELEPIHRLACVANVDNGTFKTLHKSLHGADEEEGPEEMVVTPAPEEVDSVSTDDPEEDSVGSYPQSGGRLIRAPKAPQVWDDKYVLDAFKSLVKSIDDNYGRLLALFDRRQAGIGEEEFACKRAKLTVENSKRRSHDAANDALGGFQHWAAK